MRQSAIDFSRGTTRVVILGDRNRGPGVRLCGSAFTFIRERSELPRNVDNALAEAAREGYRLGRNERPDESVIVTARLTDDGTRVEVIVAHTPTPRDALKSSSDEEMELEYRYGSRNARMPGHPAGGPGGARSLLRSPDSAPQTEHWDELEL